MGLVFLSGDAGHLLFSAVVLSVNQTPLFVTVVRKVHVQACCCFLLEGPQLEGSRVADAAAVRFNGHRVNFKIP